MRRCMLVVLLALGGCGKKAPAEAPAAATSTSTSTSTPTSTSTSNGSSNRTAAAEAARAGKLSCALTSGGGRAGPDCVTAEIGCGQRIVGHTKGGVDRYDTRWYEKNTCWPATRNHNGGDERVYVFYPDKSPRFQRGETRQRVTVTFDSPCADLTFSHMRGQHGTCPGATALNCDSANPFTRKNGVSTSNLTVDAGEVWYFLVEGADDEEGAFSLTVACGT